MARYPSSLYGKRRGGTRRWIYIISALLIAAVSYYIYHIASRRAPNALDTTCESVADTNIESEATPPVAIAPEPAPEPEPSLPEIALELAAEPNSRIAEFIAEATACIDAKPARIIEARDRLNEALPICQSGQQRAFVKEQLSELAERWLFSRTIFPQDKLCGSLQVKPGDLLSTIGTQHKMPYEILAGINRIRRPETLQAGEAIKVINGPFHVRIYRSTFTMDLYLQNTFVRSFPVGLGKPGKETPTGVWLVKPGGKLISPTWTDPDTGKRYEAENPDYPLGSRWIGLEGIEGAAKGRTGFAIHGTKDPAQIGAATSRGCIRLHNGNAILMYNLLMPGFSRVEVVE